MATVAYTRIQPGAGEDIPTGVMLYQWTLAASDDGVPVAAPQYSGKVVSIDTGAGTVTMQGTLSLKSETPTWATLHDPASGDIVLGPGATEIRQVLEDCVQIRPVNGAGGAAVIRLMINTTARR